MGAPASFSALSGQAGVAPSSMWSGPAAGDDILLLTPEKLKALPAGTEVTIAEVRGEWSRVVLADGRDAWVTATAVEEVIVEIVGTKEPRWNCTSTAPGPSTTKTST